MKFALLLTGLQNNFEVFVENQLKCFIEKYNCDVFISTSNDNSHKSLQKNNEGNIRVYNEKFVNEENYFREFYKESLKGIFIDKDDKEFNKFKEENIDDFENTLTNFQMNVISYTFKIEKAISLMKQYEKENNFLYDIVFKIQLNSFFSDNFKNYNLLNFDYKNKVYCTILGGRTHKEESAILLSRDNVDVINDILFNLIKIRKNFLDKPIQMLSLFYDCVKEQNN